MKRVTYISKASYPLSFEDIANIERVSVDNNKQAQITGFFIYYEGFFFQIIEGEADKVDLLYKRILTDNRHTEILCLKSENEIITRLFPDWSMQRIDLDNNTSSLTLPFKALLQTLTQSHLIIEKYTQRSIIKKIEKGLNPLDLLPQMTEKVVLFCDLMSFSTFTEKLSVEEVVVLLNQYLTTCTQVINHRGGEVNKFMGDCVMAYFEPDQVNEAIEGSLEILAKVEKLRDTAGENSYFQEVYCGIGLAQGIVLEGNLGSGIKQDYTIIGDAVNMAERLEAQTRHLPYFLAFSEPVQRSLDPRWDVIEVGQFHPKGKAAEMKVYSVTNPINNKPCLDLSEKIKKNLETLFVGD